MDEPSPAPPPAGCLPGCGAQHPGWPSPQSDRLRPGGGGKAPPAEVVRRWSPQSPFLVSFDDCEDAPQRHGLGARAAPAGDREWTVEDSSQLYNVEGWGAPYFSINQAGHLCIRPRGEEGPVIDLFDLTTCMQAKGLQPPLLFRFPEVVAHRMQQLQGCFNAAVERYEYQGCFQGVFPVKCNHDKDLLAAVLAAGQRHAFGLEAGSKAELLLAMSLLSSHPGALLVCNGYKDAEYVQLVLQCCQLGIHAFVVLEQAQELSIVLEAAHAAGVRPALGVRARLATRHDGHWGGTSGEAAKFGLRPREIMHVVGVLAAAGMLDCLQLLHFHIGSQITNIRVVKEAMSEAAYLYAELVHLGAPMRYCDVGGGLGIDYDGTNTDAPASLSYTMQSYANDVVCALRDVCIERAIAAPTIVSESGRALASHHAVLVFNVVTRPSPLDDSAAIAAGARVAGAGFPGDGAVTGQLRAAARSGKGHFLLATFREVLAALVATGPSLREAYADAIYFKEEALRAFKLGVLSLEERAAVDLLFDATCARIRDLAAAAQLPLPAQLQPSARSHAALYHINLSVFRSAPDAWAIRQVFPTLPLHRLGERPGVAATLADLTCDSDGKVDAFIAPPDSPDPAPVLPLHGLVPGQPYLLAMLLTGVYQEVMGSAHNMFGTTHAVVVRSADVTNPVSGDTSSSACSEDDEGSAVSVDTTEGGACFALGDGFVVEHVVPGETMQQVLGRAQHLGPEMLQAVHTAAARAVAGGRLGHKAGAALVSAYGARMQSYTYLAT